MKRSNGIQNSEHRIQNELDHVLC